MNVSGGASAGNGGGGGGGGYSRVKSKGSKGNPATSPTQDLEVRKQNSRSLIDLVILIVNNISMYMK